MFEWIFTAIDNGGKHHKYTITATSKIEAIDKGFQLAKKYANGDICGSWNCSLCRPCRTRARK